MERKKLIPLATFGIATAEFAAACSGNNPGVKILSEELNQKTTEDGRSITSILVDSNNSDRKAELEVNEGLNVRIDDNINGISQGTIIGKIKTGSVVSDVILFDSGNSNFIASECDEPAIELVDTFKTYLEEAGNLNKAVCYFDADYTKEINPQQ